MKKVNVLGTEYGVYIANDETCSRLKDIDGFCDTSTKEIYVNDFSLVPDDDTSRKCGNVWAIVRRVLLHELIHAFLFESGMDANSHAFCPDGWGTDEEIVDFFALQFFKIKDAFDEASGVVSEMTGE